MPVRYIPHPIRSDAYDVLGGRAYAGIYQNNRLRPLVVVSTSWHVVVLGGVGAVCRVVAYIGAPTPPVNAVGYGGYVFAVGVGTIHSTISFHVPPGWYYRILQFAAGGNINALNEWWEWWL